MTNQRVAPSLGLEWEAPPSKFSNGRGRRVNPQLQKIADELRDHPDTWARVAEYSSASSASALAGRISKGAQPWGPEGSFESVSRGGNVYARFKGEGSDSEPSEDEEEYSGPGPVPEGW